MSIIAVLQGRGWRLLCEESGTEQKELKPEKLSESPQVSSFGALIETVSWLRFSIFQMFSFKEGKKVAKEKRSWRKERTLCHPVKSLWSSLSQRHINARHWSFVAYVPGLNLW